LGTQEGSGERESEARTRVVVRRDARTKVVDWGARASGRGGAEGERRNAEIGRRCGEPVAIGRECDGVGKVRWACRR
jgi:hypothetical protein